MPQLLDGVGRRQRPMWFETCNAALASEYRSWKDGCRADVHTASVDGLVGWVYLAKLSCHIDVRH